MKKKPIARMLRRRKELELVQQRAENALESLRPKWDSKDLNAPRLRTQSRLDPNQMTLTPFVNRLQLTGLLRCHATVTKTN